MITDVNKIPSDAAAEKQHFQGQNVRSLVVVPMSYEGKLLGFIGFDSVTSRKQWNEDDKAILRLFAKFFSHAIERKSIEDKLQKIEKRWQFALEGSGDAVWDWDVESNYVFFSDRWKSMLGYQDHEIQNSFEEWEKRIHPDDIRTVKEDLKKHFSGKTVIYQNEHRILCRNGIYKWVLDRGKVIERNNDGSPRRVIGTHSDITIRKLAEDERENLIAGLRDALKKVNTLSGLLPICSHCKKIRNDKGYWQQIEDYIQEHSQAEFSHGLCKDCMKKYYPDT